MAVTYIYKCDGCGKRLRKAPKKGLRQTSSGRLSWAIQVTFNRSNASSYRGEFCEVCAPPLQAIVRLLSEKVPRE